MIIKGKLIIKYFILITLIFYLLEENTTGQKTRSSSLVNNKQTRYSVDRLKKCILDLDSMKLEIMNLNLIVERIEKRNKINSNLIQSIDSTLSGTSKLINSTRPWMTYKADSISKDSSDLYVEKYFALATNYYNENILISDYLNKQIKIRNGVSKNEIDSINKEKEKIVDQIKNVEKLAREFSMQTFESFEIKYLNSDYFIFVSNLDSHDIKFHLKEPETKKNYYDFNSLINSNQFSKSKPLMITNAGMFMPDFMPEGLLIEGLGNKISELDTTSVFSDANFYLKPNGVFYIDTSNFAGILSTELYLKESVKRKFAIKYATQSGPMLVINGQLHKAFTENSLNKKIRSGVGIRTSKNIIFVISKNEVNFFDFASLFRDILNCQNALYLDGAISKMYLYDINSQEKGGRFGPLISVSKKID